MLMICPEICDLTVTVASGVTVPSALSVMLMLPVVTAAATTGTGVAAPTRAGSADGRDSDRERAPQARYRRACVRDVEMQKLCEVRTRPGVIHDEAPIRGDPATSSGARNSQIICQSPCIVRRMRVVLASSIEGEVLLVEDKLLGLTAVYLN